MRNALLMMPSRPGDFAWTPADVPTDFRLERRPAPAELSEVVKLLIPVAISSDWDKAKTLAAHLAEHARDSTPIRADLRTTYIGIRQGRGYCGDFVKVFLALAHAAGIVARQWAFSFDGFGGHGHTFVEVFDRGRDKWLFLDVYNNFHGVDPQSGEPLSAFEVRDSLQGRRVPMLMGANGPGRPGFVHRDKALEYYRRGLSQWYLYWGNAVLSGDAHPVVHWAGRLGGGVGEAVSTLLDARARIRILPTPESGPAVTALIDSRSRLRVAALLLFGLLLALAIQLAGLWPWVVRR